MITPEQVYREGAYKGLAMGGYLTAVSLACLFGHVNPMLSIAGLLMALGVPPVQYSLMSSVYRKYGSDARFSSLWTLGVMTFLCGSLVCALITCGVLQFGVPGYFYERGQAALDIMATDKTLRASELYTTLKLIVDEGLMPSPVEYCIQMSMLTILSGSLLSMLLVPIVRLRGRKHN